MFEDEDWEDFDDEDDEDDQDDCIEFLNPKGAIIGYKNK